MTLTPPTAVAAARPRTPEEMAAIDILTHTVAFLVAASSRAEIAALLRTLAKGFDSSDGR